MNLSHPPESPGEPQPATDARHPGGMRASRVMPTNTHGHLDPFVLFERFFIESGQGFGTHPHRGFEIVSYMLDGGMDHEDSTGAVHTARAGDVMRVTTGGGIEHSELPANNEPCNGLQLWVDLPREQKEIAPGYQDASADDLPVTELPGATVKTVVGEGSPIELKTPVTYLDATVSDAWTWDPAGDETGFLYVIEGEGRVDRHAATDAPLTAGDFITADDETVVELSTEDGLRAVAISGQPHGQRIRQRGPFVE